MKQRKKIRINHKSEGEKVGIDEQNKGSYLEGKSKYVYNTVQGQFLGNDEVSKRHKNSISDSSCLLY